jgi:superfamily II RNA helicase
LLHCRAGSHHAGQLPGWRLLIEKMMVLGHLEVIFSTSTVAAGVNFPARTVVLVQSDRFNGRTFVDMTATDLHQMTGRAGRRGMDNAGFTLVVPGRFLNIGLVKELVFSEPEPCKSRIAVNFSMTLNLLLST